MIAKNDIVAKFMAKYVSIDEDGFEYVNAKDIKKITDELSENFDNIVIIVETNKLGYKHFTVRSSSKTKKVFFKAFLVD